MDEREVIIDVGVELGSLILYGVRTNGGWVFQRNVVDQTPFMLDEAEIRHDSNFTDSWDEALSLLDEYPWRQMYPIKVHPEFREAVWAALQNPQLNGGRIRMLEQWKELCGIGAQTSV